MKPIRIAVLLTAIAILLSCNNTNQRESAHADDISLQKNQAPLAINASGASAQVDEQKQPVIANEARYPEQGEAKQTDKPGRSAVAQPVDWDRKIVKTAVLNAQVKDHDVYYRDLRETVKRYGGYVAQEDRQQNEYKIQSSLTIRVPVDQFDDALATLAGNVETINEKKIMSQDVTGEMVDTRSRIETKKQVKLRYSELLNQAKNMEDILRMQSEINGVQEQIESAMGQINYLIHSSAFSTIHITYYQVLNALQKEPEAPTVPEKITGAFANGWNWVADLFIALVSIWPLFLLSVIVYLLYKRLRFQRTKPGVKTQVSE